MSLKSRILQKIFGTAGPSTEFGQIGSKAAAAPIKTKDLALMQSLPEYDQGLNAIVSDQGTSVLPYLEDLNSLFLLITSQLAYIMQSGIPEWNTETEYYQGVSMVLFNGEIWIDTFGTPGTPNLNFNPGTNPTKWTAILSVTLLKAQNLNDVANKATSRTNLDVYDKSTAATKTGPETLTNKTLTTPVINDGVNVNKVNTIKDQGVVAASGLKYKILNIGSWNMNSIGSIDISHGLTLSNIISVSILIIDDDGDKYPLDYASPAGVAPGFQRIDSTNVKITAITGDFYQLNPLFNGAGNRGHITILYAA